MWWMWLAKTALAGQIFVNGAPVDPEDLAGTTVEQADVRFDDDGNVHIEAPGLAAPEASEDAEPVAADPAVSHAGTDVAPVDAPAPVAGPEPVAEAVPVAEGVPAGASEPGAGGSASGQGTAAPWPEPSASSVPLSRITARGLHPSGVPEARWWLVVEDDGSRGHTVEILINDELVATLRSGEIPRILDVGAHLVPGGNRVVLRSTSAQASGGPLYVYLGSGSDRDGTVMLDEPEVQFALGASRSGTYQREYTVTVD